jgi:cytochrome c oxidase cbb3-type subunit 3
VSRGRGARVAAAVTGAALVALLGACEREQRRFSEVAPAAGRSAGPAESAGPRPAARAARPPVPGPYDDNAWAVSEGQRLYAWFNCQGCHSMGGGGMGPALMDDTWLYGDDPRDIFASIAAGRPNGMPAFGPRIADQQIWQLVAYVRSLGALARKDVLPGRSDSLSGRPAPSMTTPASPVPAGPPPPPPR